MPNPALDGKNKLISIYNLLREADGQVPFNLEDFVFSTPETYLGIKSTKNTKITIRPKDSASIYGRTILYYDRIDLSTINNLAVIKGAATTVLGLLPEINEEMGTELSDLDVEEEALGTGPDFTMTATSSNLVFIGTALIEFVV